MPTVKKVIIADDHMIFRVGLKQVITTNTELEVAGEASTGEELLRKVQEKDFDLVILDISMPGRSGLDTLTELRKIKPKLPVLVLSMHPEEQYAMRAFKSGASGYLSKGNPTSELLCALQKIMIGKKYVSADFAESFVSNLGEHSRVEAYHDLSNREYQVLCMIASGKPVSKIALELSLSVKTISTYRTHILRKLNLQNNSEMTRFALENKLV